MGILKTCTNFAKELKGLGMLPDRFSVCELGDQWVTHTKPHILGAHFFKHLGCGRYVSIDGNGRGTITHDLNLPITLEPFDVVTDFGTGEHIFDQAQVWRTIHNLTKPGGYIIFDRPSQGYKVHCYYLTERCLFDDIAAANYYKILHLQENPGSRGQLIRGVFRRPKKALPFAVPQQGRYHKILKIPTQRSA